MQAAPFSATIPRMARFDYRQTENPPPGNLADRWNVWLRHRPEVPYVLPFFAYLVVMLPEGLGEFSDSWKQLWRNGLPVFYAVKSVLAALLLWYFWNWYTRIRWTKLGLGVIIGLLGTVLWIGTELLCQQLGIVTKPSDADIYNPDVLGGGWKEMLFLCVRVAGPTLVVPLMEELFFRDFLMRAFIRGWHFEQVPVGTFTWLSLVGMSVLFGFNHGWNYFFPGVLYGLLMGILLIRTKSLGACIVAHGVTNWTLYLYVIYRGDWQFM
jgi:uncharacterized protein